MRKGHESNSPDFSSPGILGRLYIYFIFCCADIIALLFYLRFSSKKKRINRIHTNIKTVFPSFSDAEEKQLTRNYNKEMGKVAASYFVLYLIPDRYIKSIVTYENIQLLNDLFKEGKNVVLLFPHYNNWTYITALPLFTDYKIFATYAVENKLSKIRRKHGMTLIHRNKLYRYVLKKADNTPAIYTILPDQMPAPPFKHSVDFLNQKMYIQVGAEKIIKQTNSVAVCLDIKRISKYNYSFHFGLFSEKVDSNENLLPYFYADLEKKIKAKPALWYRWNTTRWNTAVTHVNGPK